MQSVSDAFGIVIPAHNEERALARCLEALVSQESPGEVELVVVPNGCDDRTADVARGFEARLPVGWTLKVIECPAAQKSLALNAGDRALAAGPRMYLDADILLEPTALRRLAEALRADAPRLVQPQIAAVTGPTSSRAVRSFVRVWSSLPYVRNQVLGVGCFAVNAEGRDRWDEFPDIGADDTYVRFRFAGDQKQVVPGATMKVFFPASTGELIRVRARWCKLSRDARGREATLPPGESGRWKRALKYLVARPGMWIDGLFFSIIWICAVALSFAPAGGASWARADSSSVRA